ncbi:MAG: DUF1349 domain-containing protein [Anaerolineae bacterium]|nr:DUF1349 domain-containing protein [Thermoflexales bacterium]MDW8406427.1 DUF1349 domain-containing protein [Anaerolineae bacterium]
MNLLHMVSSNELEARGLIWQNEPAQCLVIPEGGLRVVTPAQTDYFQDPLGSHTKDSAPFLWMAVQGDFVAQAYVRPHFAHTWDAGALMVRYDQQHWAKLCYESTDLPSTAIVSVVTHGVSDDANGVDLTVPDVWLQIARVGNVFAMHYSLDRKQWRMVRLFALPVPHTLKVGLVAQCPVGPAATVDFLHFSIEHRAIKHLRAGV